MVEQSKVLNTPGAEKRTKRKLFDSLGRELETPVLEKESKAVWGLILDVNGPVKGRGDESEKLKEVEIPKPSARKRSFAEMSMQDGPETLASDSTDQLVVGSENVTAPGTNGTASETNQS